MKIISDIHIHSRFSRATSNDLSIANLVKYAKIKGVNLLGTGDFTHPSWIREIRSEIAEDGTGILKTQDGFPFILSGEISSIYMQDKRLRRIHNIILSPDFDTVGQVNEALKGKGVKLESDGRPICGISSPELVEILKGINPKNEVIPAHIWTPWFSLFGSKSGFDNIEDCFKDQTKNIHALETGLSCYDEKTEVLTENGWKKFPGVKYSDKICTLNTKTNKIEYQRPFKKFFNKYDGKMYRLKTKRIDLFVTPNHNLLISHCDFRKQPEFLLKRADHACNKSKRFKKDGVWDGRKVKYFRLPAVKIKHGSRYYSGFRQKGEMKLPVKDWLKFFGFWIAEGWTTQGKNSDYNVCISNKDESLLSEMKQTIKNLGYNFYHDNKINNTIRIRDYQLFHYLRRFGKCYDKHVPKDIKSLSRDLLKVLLEYYIKGDGHIYGRTERGLSATTSSIRLRDDLQEIALKIGISAYYKLDKKKGSLIFSPGQKKIYKRKNDTWVIYFIRQNIHTVLPSTIKKHGYKEVWQSFKGPVYCVSVPNKVIYVRRNGIPVWCGNSDPAMNWRLSSLDRFALVSFSDSHSFWPWRIGREATIFELKELTYDNLIKALRTKEGLAGTIEVDPSYGKYHYDGHRDCNVSLAPKDSEKLRNVCPVCRRPLTIGVLHRVEELADRPEGFVPENAKPFHSLIPLSEIIAFVVGTSVSSGKVWEEYNKLVNAFGSELNVLMEADEERMGKTVKEKIAEMIIKARTGKIKIKPGYDGVYGELESDSLSKRKKRGMDTSQKPQKTLGDF